MHKLLTSRELVFSPPLNVPASWNAISPVSPKVPRSVRSCGSGRPTVRRWWQHAGTGEILVLLA